jgi:hypothetical protein
LAEAAYQYVDEPEKRTQKEAGLKMVEGKEEYKEDDLEASTRLFINTSARWKK